MITISLRMDKKRLAALVLALALAGAGAVCAKQMLWQNVLPAYGWEVEEEPLEIQEVLIPSEFDETYEKYNYIQKQQGFDLSRYRGKVCRKYVYALPGYPGGVEDARITLLIYKDRVIGGDISSPSADGFMHGFDASSSVWLGLEQLA